jgi:hypothetical protein
MNSTAMEKRVKQAHELGLDRREAVARTSRLLRELDAYLARRQNRRYHTDFDDLLNTLMPGLALALQLLIEEEAVLEDAALEERWPDVRPEMLELLQQLAATFGLEYADRVVVVLGKEVERRQERLANERTDLVLFVMEWAETQLWPRFRGDGFDVHEGLDAWGTFCGDAPIGQLRTISETIHLRQRAADGRRRLEQLSPEE